MKRTTVLTMALITGMTMDQTMVVITVMTMVMKMGMTMVAMAASMKVMY